MKKSNIIIISFVLILSISISNSSNLLTEAHYPGNNVTDLDITLNLEKNDSTLNSLVSQI